MGSVFLRRNFIILIVICCLLLFIFIWHSRTSEALLKFNKSSSLSNEMTEQQEVNFSQHIPPSKEFTKENEFWDIFEDVKTSIKTTPEEKLVSDLAEYEFIPISRSHKRHHDDSELFSGPTDYEDDIPVTIPVKRYPDAKMEFSGPIEEDIVSGVKLEYEFIPISSSHKRHPDDPELFSGPTDYEDDIPVTLPVKHSDTKRKFSGPNEEEIVSGVKHVTSPMQENKNLDNNDLTIDNKYHQIELASTPAYLPTGVLAKYLNTFHLPVLKQ